MIDPPGFRWTIPNGLSITTWNSINRDMTWSDLGEAIVAIAQLMVQHGWEQPILSFMKDPLRLGGQRFANRGPGDQCVLGCHGRKRIPRTKCCS